MTYYQNNASDKQFAISHFNGVVYDAISTLDRDNYYALICELPKDSYTTYIEKDNSIRYILVVRDYTLYLAIRTIDKLYRDML